MDQSNPPKHGLPLGRWHPYMSDGEEGMALPRDLNARLLDYSMPPMPSPSEKEGENYRITLRRPKAPLRETIKGKMLGAVVGLSLGSCASVPLSYFMSEPSPAAAAAADGVAPDSEQAKYLAHLTAAFDKVQAGASRGTIVLDLGHGDYTEQKDDGSLGKVEDPGAVFTMPGGRDIHEAEIVEAMGARTALQLIQRGYKVTFTRHIDLKENPHLSELLPTERAIIEQINSPVKVLANRFDARIETARHEAAGGKPVMYLVLHADSAPNPDRRGAALSISPYSPTDSASYRLSKSLQEHYRHADGGSLSSNVEKGIIPAQKGFGALFDGDCKPEIALGTRDVWIIAPKPVGDRFSRVRNGLQDIPYSLVELGNLNHAGDRWRLRDQKWGNNLARATAEGVDAFFAREYEGAKAPPSDWITLNDKKVRVLPENPEERARVADAMVKAIPAEKAATTTFIDRPVTRCEPDGKRYTIRVAEYGTVKPKKPDAPRKPTDFATRDEVPKNRT